MKALVVYYSGRGRTKKVAEAISNILSCDIEELVDTEDRTGLLGYIHAGRQAMKKKHLKFSHGLMKILETYISSKHQNLLTIHMTVCL